MTGLPWERVKSVFAEVMAREPVSRAAFLHHLGQSDPALRDEVASLVSSADESGSFPALRAAIATGVGDASDASLQALLTSALGQQYDIVRPLGRGGMGAVYLARERALERFVAVKVLRPDLANEEDGRERFRREARIVAQLSHPSILPLHTFGEVRGTWYFVMGYVRGVSLAERLRVEGRLPSADVHRILAELAAALECAHRHGVVHRDIKPANILLDTESGRAVLADFGISKVKGGGDSLTVTGLVVGTPHFMAPEQALGSDDVDERSDLYSLGAVGYAMLAGREPFAGMSAEQVIYHRLTHDAPSLDSIAPSVPAYLAELVMRCLARDPADRWPSARSLKEALARARGEPAALPDALRELPMFGPYALIWAAIWTSLAAQPFRSIIDRAFLLLIALLVPAGLVLQLWSTSREGLSRRELMRISFWPPEWWGMWWPRALRRPSDLWARLPWPARAVRVLVSAAIVAIPALILMRQWAEATTGAPVETVRQSFERAQWGVAVLALTGVVTALVWSRAQRLPVRNALRLLLGATSPDRGWESPEMARLLTSGRARFHMPAGDSSSEYMQALVELAQHFDQTETTDAAVVLRAARDLHEAIVRCDEEVARLSLDASAGELDRLSARIGAFEADLGATSDRRRLLIMLRDQHDLLQRMRWRCELVARQRSRLFSLLRGLWQRLAMVYEAAATQGTGASITRMHVQDVLDEISKEASLRPEDDSRRG